MWNKDLKKISSDIGVQISYYILKKYALIISMMFSSIIKCYGNICTFVNVIFLKNKFKNKYT